MFKFPVYPDYAWRRITAFRFETPLILERGIDAVKARSGEDADYILAGEYQVSYAVDGSPWQGLAVPAGLATDLASVPPIARVVIDRVGPHLEAAIVHDFLYGAWQQIRGRGARRADRRFADAIFLAGMKEAGVAWWRRQLIYWSVRICGWPHYSRRAA